MLTGKTVLIGITGAIAAYKTCELIRLFKKYGANFVRHHVNFEKHFVNSKRHYVNFSLR